MKPIFQKIVRFYQLWLSRSVRYLFGPGCRFTPTCSQYCAESIERFGMVHGTILTIKRLLRCHPWGGIGFDPVPKK